MKKLVVLFTLALSALVASAAVVRKLPALTVVEGESISIDSMDAKYVRSANTTIFSAALRESGEAVITGSRLGEAQLNYVDDRGTYATRLVTVVPGYWEMLKKLFMEDPEIMIEIIGDKVVVSGATANVDTLRRVESVKSLDSRLVVQVTYSPAQIGEIVTDFLTRSTITNVNVKVVGREVCLSGKMYDQQSIEQVKARVSNFLKDFPGISVNIDQLRVYKQKISIQIEFLQYNTNLARNLGFKGPEAITAEYKGEFGYTDVKAVENSVSLNAQAAINLLKEKGAAKSMSSTTLTTQSGVEATFQNGGTIHKQTSDLYKSDMKEIEYGYIVKATPFIVDENSVNLDFDIDVKTYQMPNANGDYQIPRYSTSSKYLMRPGETIVLSGYKSLVASETKNGTPLLSHIPLIGSWLFGNRNSSSDEAEVVLVVTVDWLLEDDSDSAKSTVESFKSKSIEVEMP